MNCAQRNAPNILIFSPRKGRKLNQPNLILSPILFNFYYLIRFNCKDEPKFEITEENETKNPAQASIKKKKSKLEKALNEKLGSSITIYNHLNS